VVGTIVDRDNADGVRRRRHGEELREAICDAVLARAGGARLCRTDHGRGRGSRAHRQGDAVPALAEQGRTGCRRPRIGDARVEVLADRGDLRAELVNVLRQVADGMAAPSGEAARGLVAELVRSPALAQAVRPLLIDTSLAPMLEVLRRAAVRGEIPVTALTPRYASIGTDLLRHTG